MAGESKSSGFLMLKRLTSSSNWPYSWAKIISNATF